MRGEVHLVGIGGAGMSAIAKILIARGERVRGSDRERSAYAQTLEAIGVPIVIGHRAENIAGASLVVASSAIPEDNVELAAARAAGIPVLRRKDFLPEIVHGKRVVAVAGTHGKTTTTALIAWILQAAGKAPSFIVGGQIRGLGTNAQWGDGQDFVIEADEYDRTFLGLEPWLAVVTNVEHDHPDCYPTEAEFKQAFQAFAARVRSLLMVCAEDPGARELSSAKARVETYGLEAEALWRAEEIRPNAAGGSDFLVSKAGETLGLARSRLPGRHNVLNALAAFAASAALEVEFAQAREALTSFQGVGRRFEIMGTAGGVTVIDDYAHHPTEIQATLQAARQRYPRSRIWAVFQPHTYSRLRTLLPAFAKAFSQADQVVVLEVFAAREAPDMALGGRQIAESIEHPQVTFAESIEQAVELLAGQVQSGDVVITLSAGDGNRVGALLLKGRGNEGAESNG